MEYAKGIRVVQFVDDVATAQTDADSGVCFINAGLWQALSREQRYFLLLHESAHLSARTDDELTADAGAIIRFQQRFPRSRAPLTLLQRVLNPARADHRARLMQCQNLLNHA